MHAHWAVRWRASGTEEPSLVKPRRGLVLVFFISHVAPSTRKGLKWASKEGVYTRSWRQFSRKEVMVSVLLRHHCFGARGVAAIRSICAYPADAIADCWVPLYVCWQVCREANVFTNELWSSYPTAATTPVTKVSRNITTRTGIQSMESCDDSCDDAITLYKS